jgi:hypothetical protein
VTEDSSLAVYAPSVPSKLDQFPPGSRQGKKRKLEAQARAKEKAQARKRARQEANGVEKPATPKAKAKSPVPFQMETRRVTRQAAAAAKAKPAPLQPNSNTGLSTARQKKTSPAPVVNEIPPNMPKVSGDLSALDLGYMNTIPAPKQSKTKKSVPKATVMEPSEPTSVPTSQAVTGTTSDLTTNHAATTPAQVKVEYFARIHTTKGMVEVPMTAEDLGDDTPEMMQKYAEWMEKNGKHMSYSAFKSTIGFAKKG